MIYFAMWTGHNFSNFIELLWLTTNKNSANICVSSPHIVGGGLNFQFWYISEPTQYKKITNINEHQQIWNIILIILTNI